MEKVTNLAKEMKVMPALCLDLDGTVRRSKTGESFIKNFSDIELMPGIEKLIWIYRKMGFAIIGISNQGGVAHGYKLPVEIEYELEVTFKLFENNPFHIVKLCYHMADGKIEPYCHRSLLRKPNIGMLAIAENDAYNNGIIIDWDKSLFVGDRPEDEQCAKNAGIKYEHIDSFLVSPKEFVIADEPEKPALIIDGNGPQNLDELVAVLLPRFAGLEDDKFFKMGEDSFTSFCHSQLSGGIGMQIRNEYGLWQQDSFFHKYFKREFNCENADAMSAVILRAVYKKMVIIHTKK